MPTRYWRSLVFTTYSALVEKSKFLCLLEECGRKADTQKELTEGHHQVWSLRLNLTQHGKPHPVQTWLGLAD